MDIPRSKSSIRILASVEIYLRNSLKMACTSLPVINNGYITASTATKVEYECLSGFELVGNKAIECDTTKGWPQAPSCKVILDNVSFTDETKNYFAPDWWYIFMAIMLCIFLLLCVISFIWCCVCKKWGGATVYPVADRKDIERANDSTNQAKPLLSSPCSNQSTVDHNWKRERLLTPDDLVGRQKSGTSITPVETNQVPPVSTSSVFVVNDSISRRQPESVIHVQSQHQEKENRENIHIPSGNGWSKNDKLMSKTANKSQPVEARILKETNRKLLGRTDTFSKQDTIPQNSSCFLTSTEISQKPRFISHENHDLDPKYSASNFHTVHSSPLSIHHAHNIAEFISSNDNTPDDEKKPELKELEVRKLNTATSVEFPRRDDDVIIQMSKPIDDYILQETVYYRTKKNMHPSSYIDRRKKATNNTPHLSLSSGVYKNRPEKKVLDKKPMWCPHTKPITKSIITPYVWR